MINLSDDINRSAHSSRLTSKRFLLVAGLIASGGLTLANAEPPAPAPVALAQARPAKPITDWAGLKRYRENNTKLSPPTAGENRVVFMGDSITDAWQRKQPEFFTALMKIWLGKSPADAQLKNALLGKTPPPARDMNN